MTRERTEYNNQQYTVGIVTTAGDAPVETGEEVRGRTSEDVSDAPLVRPSETGRDDVCTYSVILTSPRRPKLGEGHSMRVYQRYIASETSEIGHGGDANDDRRVMGRHGRSKRKGYIHVC